MKGVNDIVKIVYYKDGWMPSRPWAADAILLNGQKISGICYGYRTKIRMMEDIGNPTGIEIVRGEDR